MMATQEPSPDVVRPRIVTGLSELASGYDAVLCDIWGVIHNGETCYAAAAAALARFRAAGGTVVLITNAPRPSGPVRQQLDEIGVPHSAFDDMVTSGDVTLASIMQRGEAPLYHIGPVRDLDLFKALVPLGGLKPPLAGLKDATYAVVTGLFGDETGTPEDYDDQLEAMHQRRMTLICANPDLVVHVGDALRYCAGAIAERYAAKGGAVIYAGKPHAPIYETALAKAEGHRGGSIARSRVLAIGDALRTDIAGAALQGIDALFITAGIHRDESHRTGDGRLDPEAYARMIEAAEQRPLAAIETLAW